jgi:predicted ATPase
VQDTAYESLLKSRRQIPHQKIAETLRETFADVVEAEPELLAHHFTQAGLTSPAIEYWGKAGDLALRRSAFKEAIAHLGKAIEMTEAGGTGEKEKSGEQLKLLVSYGNALMATRGYGAPETTAAFERERELATGVEDVGERLSVNYGLWIASHVRGDLGAMREFADAFFRDHMKSQDPCAASVANRILGATQFFAGEFVEARANLERAVSIFDSERETNLTIRFGHDIGISAMGYSVFALWPLGEVDLAARRAEDLAVRAAKPGNALSAAVGYGLCTLFAILGLDVARAIPLARALSKIAGEREMALITSLTVSMNGWVAWRSGQGSSGLVGLRQGIARQQQRQIVVLAPLFESALAEAEAEAGQIEVAIATIDHVLAESARTGQHWHDAETHRIRGEILLKQNPADPTATEDSFLAAIAIARAQKTRSFQLRAALSLAKLYRATGRDADAHAVLRPALEGFAATPEFPEIAEAKALFDALAETDAVKATVASRKKRVDLHAAYGSAVLQGRGIHAPETRAAFERARELAAGDASRPQITFGLWAGAYARGELGQMRAFADALQQEVADSPRSPVAGVARRVLGVTKHYEGDFLGARSHLEQALAIFNPARDGELASRFTADPGVLAMAYLAQALWAIDEVDRARRVSEDLSLRMSEVSDASSLGYGHAHRAGFELMRGDFGRAAHHAKALAEIERDHEIAQWQPFRIFFEGWIEWHVGDREAGISEMRRAISRFAELKFVTYDGLRKAVLAKAEAESREIDAALSTIDSAIVVSERTEHRTYDAEVHRTRGEILYKQNPAKPAPAEDAFLTAIAIAPAQKTRSFQLRAALGLAKLYRATGRDADAHAVLGPALEGFAPTPEFREIGEALAFMAANDAGARS